MIWAKTGGVVKKGIFFDKDGTLIENVPYNADASKIRLLPFAVEGLKMLGTAGYELILVTNQPGIARGFFTEKELGSVEAKIRELLSLSGIHLADFAYCPHLPQGSVAQFSIDCACRKPSPGLIQKAAQELGIFLESSWCIGDILNDVEAGNAAGCRSILVNNGHETEWVLSRERLPDHIVSNLLEAAAIITAVDATEELLARAHPAGRFRNKKIVKGHAYE